MQAEIQNDQKILLKAIGDLINLLNTERVGAIMSSTPAGLGALPGAEDALADAIEDLELVANDVSDGALDSRSVDLLLGVKEAVEGIIQEPLILSRIDDCIRRAKELEEGECHAG